MTIRTIVNEVIRTRVFTATQEEQINSLIQHKQFNTDDMKILGDLVDALSQGVILTLEE